MLRPRTREGGFALPLALLILVGIGLVATVAAFLSDTDLRISSSYGGGNRAVAAAEAAIEHGMVELTERARAGQDPDGIVIVTDTIDGFAYTVTATSKREHSGVGGKDFNGDGDKTDVVLYDQSFGYAAARATGAAGDPGAPVKQLVAVASRASARAEVRAEVARDKVSGNFHSPLSLNSPSNAVLNGSFDVDGRLYTRTGTLVSSASLTPAYGGDATSKAASKTQCNYWKPGVRIPTEGALDLSGSMSSVGHVSFDHAPSENYDAEDPLSSFHFTPEEALGVLPGELDVYKKDASQVPDFTNLSGVNYVVSGSVPSKISGSGILIVHNPNYDARKNDCTAFPGSCVAGYDSDPDNQPMTVQINANGTFKGIIVVDKLIRLNGNFTMYGALVSLTTQQVNIPANGSGSLKWSCETVNDALEQATAYGIRLSWEHRVL
jgi:Tfp pilus assembly protein PilX